MNDTDVEIEHYFTTWSRVLQAYRGCSADDVKRWAAPFLGPLPELTLHQPATQWVAGALIPPEFKGGLDVHSVGQLQREVQRALDQGDDFWEPGSDKDLGEALDRVRTVIDQHRMQLPADIMGDVLATDLPRSEALDVTVRTMCRRWPRPVILDVFRNQAFEYHQIPFVKMRRLAIVHANGRVDAWHDAFGLNLAVRCPQPTRLLRTLRSTLQLTPYRTYRELAA